VDREGLFAFRPPRARGAAFQLVFERREQGVRQCVACLPWSPETGGPRVDVALWTGAARLACVTPREEPLAHRTLLLEQAGGHRARFVVVTDANGDALVERLPAGIYAARLEPCADSGPGDEVPGFVVRPGEDTTVRLRLR
jgi:hypothetical protein